MSTCTCMGMPGSFGHRVDGECPTHGRKHKEQTLDEVLRAALAPKGELVVEYLAVAVSVNPSDPEDVSYSLTTSDSPSHSMLGLLAKAGQMLQAQEEGEGDDD